MPDPNEGTLVITLTLKEALVAWSALSVLGEDMENPTSYRNRAARLAHKLLLKITIRWPHMADDDADQIFQDLKHPLIPG
jgi:hypothetical protein